MVDGGQTFIRSLKTRHSYDPENGTIICGWIDTDNDNVIIGDAGFDEEVDVLSLDMVGIDCWILKNLSVSSLWILIVEYNSLFGAEQSVTVPYIPYFLRPADAHYYDGASLSAFVSLSTSLGYSLVAIEPRGINVFFVRQDCLRNGIAAIDGRGAFKRVRKVKTAKREALAEARVFETIERRGLALIEA